MSHKTCLSASDIPVGDHFAIMTFSSYTIPGDERSRTNPGHGYPESTERTSSYTRYDSEAEWKAEIGRLTARREQFSPLIVNHSALKG